MNPAVLVVALVVAVGAGVGSAFAQSADQSAAGQGGLLFGRQAYAGLTGNHGTVTVGRQHDLDTIALTEAGDPFKGGMGRQVDNSINVDSRQVRGVSAGASWGADARSSTGSGNRALGVSVGFEHGPLTIRAAHQNRNVAPVAPAMPLGNRLDAKNSILAANLRFGSATAYAAYSATRGLGSTPLFNPDDPYSASMASTLSTDSRDVLVGLALPCGPATLLASYIRKNDRDLANRDANQFAVGASYSLTRRTDFYAAYSRITNRNGADYAGPRGAGGSALNLGMRHGF